MPFVGAVTVHALGEHDCCDTNVPKEQEVEIPTMVYPEAHATWQEVPEERVEGQLPRVPFAGAETLQGLGTHDCVAVRTPLEQDVTGPCSE